MSDSLDKESVEDVEIVEKWLQVELAVETEDGDVLSGHVFVRPLLDSDTFAVNARMGNLAGMPWDFLPPAQAYLVQAAATVAQVLNLEHKPDWLDCSALGLLARPGLVTQLYDVVTAHTARYLRDIRRARGKSESRATAKTRIVGSSSRLPS